MAKTCLTEDERKAMEYALAVEHALLVAKKVGIDKALEEVRRDLQELKQRIGI